MQLAQLYVFTTYIALDLEQAVYNSNQDIVEVKQLKRIVDYKSWIKPFIDTPHYHTAPHNFVFRLSNEGKAVMHYRKWSSDSWLPAAPKEGLSLLKVGIIVDNVACCNTKYLLNRIHLKVLQS